MKTLKKIIRWPLIDMGSYGFVQQDLPPEWHQIDTEFIDGYPHAVCEVPEGWRAT
jgi:hypothetical protein